LGLAYVAVKLGRGKWTKKRTKKRPWGNGPLDGSGRFWKDAFAEIFDEILLNVRGGVVFPCSRKPVCKKNSTLLKYN
jgi:hypothetical protein